jgi:hypothetical protein
MSERLLSPTIISAIAPSTIENREGAIAYGTSKADRIEFKRLAATTL